MVLINLELPRSVLLTLCAGLGILLCLNLSYVLWAWHKDWVLSHQPLVTAVPKPTLNEAQTTIDALAKAHLFGKALPKGMVPTTNLQLQVNGIVKVKDEKTLHASKAYISVANEPSKIFKVGDTLVYGVKIYDITSDTVILENDGHLEKLTLAREKLEFKPLIPIHSEES